MSKKFVIVMVWTHFKTKQIQTPKEGFELEHEKKTHKRVTKIKIEVTG
jgi:hypothetical protein